MSSTPWPESVGKAEEVHLVDAGQDPHESTLDHLVLERGDPEWPLSSVRLRYEYTPDRLRPVRPPLHAAGEIREVVVQALSIALPRFAVYSRCRFPLEAEVRLAQRLDVVDVVQERRESSLPVRLCCLPYASTHPGHAFPVWCLGTRCEPAFPSARPLPRPSASGAFPSLGPLGSPWPSPRLHLRARLGLPWVLVPVPSLLFRDLIGTAGQSDSLRPYADGLRPRASHRGPQHHHRGRSQGLPVLVHGASTHARGLSSTAPAPPAPRRCRCSRCCLRPRKRTRHLEVDSISRLNTRPACAPVNASGTASRPRPHDSGSSWVASPSMCGFFSPHHAGLSRRFFQNELLQPMLEVASSKRNRRFASQSTTHTLPKAGSRRAGRPTAASPVRRREARS